MDLPVYRAIALDIAKRIVKQEFLAGTKISGRTLLASQYKVSPETIRKAIYILKENNIVSVSQGKEVLVISTQQAAHLLDHHQEIDAAYSLKQELERLIKEKEAIDKRFHKVTNEIMHYSDRLENITPYNPIEIQIAPHSAAIGKSLRELNLRQSTGTLIIAIRRGTQVLIAPGPDDILEKEDRLVVIGTLDKLNTVTTFIN